MLAANIITIHSGLLIRIAHQDLTENCLNASGDWLRIPRIDIALGILCIDVGNLGWLIAVVISMSIC